MAGIPPGMVRAVVGAQGTGKTYLMRSMVAEVQAKGWRPLVLDLNGEWSDLERVGVDALGSALADRRAVARVVEVPDQMGPKAMAELLDKVAAAVLRAPGTVLVLPEAGTWLPLHGKLLPATYTLLTRSRHRGVGVFMDFQRCAAVHATAREAAYWWYAFPVGGKADKGAYWELGGSALLDAVEVCAARFFAKQPGWHVRFSPHAPEPEKYVPTRR